MLADALAAARETEQRLTTELQAERARTAVQQAETVEQRSRADVAEGELRGLREALAEARLSFWRRWLR